MGYFCFEHQLSHEHQYPAAHASSIVASGCFKIHSAICSLYVITFFKMVLRSLTDRRTDTQKLLNLKLNN